VGEAVQNATKFKGGDYQQARAHFSVLATLFAIDAQYDEPMRWKREAPAMRDRMARAGFNCKVGTDASYKDAKSRAEELESLVRGGASQLPATSNEPSWPKIADRPPLMKRLEQAQQVLGPWTANAGEFSRHADKVSHEAQLLAALAQVISRDGYEFADDETYREDARALEEHALQVRDAVEQKNFDQARKAVGEIGKACNKCHEGYRS
jgi:cytochrome c556